MALLQGKVTYIKIGDDFAIAEIQEDGTGVKEQCPIWWYMDGDPKPEAYVRTIQQTQIMLLKEAMVSGLTVVNQWDESTGFPQNIKVLGPA
ncbi:MAG TPA: hypothetical protein VMJ66_17280 [Geobacteraceae bacterium]|nr:hypothetical protein [Geobacteraceae bacterium]